MFNAIYISIQLFITSNNLVTNSTFNLYVYFALLIYHKFFTGICGKGKTGQNTKIRTQQKSWIFNRLSIDQ